MNTKLNLKQWGIASLAVFVVLTVIAFLLNRLGIEPWAASTAQTSIVQHDPGTQRILIYVSRLILSGLFVFIFTKGQEGKPGMQEGLRYGLWIGLIMYLPGSLFGMAITDWPVAFHVTRMVEGIVETIICGGVVGMLYKQPKG